MMKIAVLGANGQIGKPIALEAIDRGHEVICITRSSCPEEFVNSQASLLHGDATNAAFLQSFLGGIDVVVDAMRPPNGDEASLAANTLTVARACRSAGVRLVVSGGAGGLKVDDDPSSPLVIESEYVQDPWRAIAEASAEQYHQLNQEEFQQNLVYIAAPAMLFDGPKIGGVRQGTNSLVKDANGQSCLSWFDFASFILDEIENPSGNRRVTGAY